MRIDISNFDQMDFSATLQKTSRDEGAKMVLARVPAVCHLHVVCNTTCASIGGPLEALLSNPGSEYRAGKSKAFFIIQNRREFHWWIQRAGGYVLPFAQSSSIRIVFVGLAKI